MIQLGIDLFILIGIALIFLASTLLFSHSYINEMNSLTKISFILILTFSLFLIFLTALINIESFRQLMSFILEINSYKLVMVFIILFILLYASAKYFLKSIE